MQYRNFGKLDFQPSALGFGCMRLPIIDGEPTHIDETEAIRMIRWAIDHGVNYVDTAATYHSGYSEIALGKALQDGYRERVHVASKLTPRLLKSAGEMDGFLATQLSKLQTDHIDFYLLHGLGKRSWLQMLDWGVFDWLEKRLAEGKIKHLGFSFHDERAVFKEIVDYYPHWDFCQIQYNYMNEDYQAGTEGLKYAADRGLPVVVMEPLLGGRLANPPQAVLGQFAQGSKQASPVDWALQWLWNQPEVSVVLSGMSTMEQVQQNVASAETSGAGSLSAKDVAVIEAARDAFATLCPIPCTKCEYCMPCPNGVDIPGNFAIYNEGLMFSEEDRSRTRYNEHMPAEKRASACIACRICEDKCPQNIVISEWMTVLDEVLGQGAAYQNCL